MNNLSLFELRKKESVPISMVTCYDAWSAKILDQTNVDCLLVGDSLAEIVYGFDSTIHATDEMMALHTAAVARSAKTKFIVADMPFLSCSRGIIHAMKTVEKLMRAGANALKIEGASHQLEIIEHIVTSGIPVMGHLGLQPQAIHNLGGNKVQGKEKAGADQILAEAKELERIGCFSIVLECIPKELGECVTKNLRIPTIGIGAGPKTDGQVLVLHDLLGLDENFSPKFLRKYAHLHKIVSSAVDKYHSDVRSCEFPSVSECY